MGIDFLNRSIFLTKNGEIMGIGFEDVSLVQYLYPTLTLGMGNGEDIRLKPNFGKTPFQFTLVEYQRSCYSRRYIPYNEIKANMISDPSTGEVHSKRLFYEIDHLNTDLSLLLRSVSYGKVFQEDIILKLSNEENRDEGIFLLGSFCLEFGIEQSVEELLNLPLDELESNLGAVVTMKGLMKYRNYIKNTFSSCFAQSDEGSTYYLKTSLSEYKFQIKEKYLFLALFLRPEDNLIPLFYEILVRKMGYRTETIVTQDTADNFNLNLIFRLLRDRLTTYEQQQQKRHMKIIRNENIPVSKGNSFITKFNTDQIIHDICVLSDSKVTDNAPEILGIIFYNLVEGNFTVDIDIDNFTWEFNLLREKCLDYLLKMSSKIYQLEKIEKCVDDLHQLKLIRTLHSSKKVIEGKIKPIGDIVRDNSELMDISYLKGHNALNISKELSRRIEEKLADIVKHMEENDSMEEDQVHTYFEEKKDTNYLRKGLKLGLLGALGFIAGYMLYKHSKGVSDNRSEHYITINI
eukprot:TRINITY_DN5718_c0_g1_i1.p1 TRINITY_DN5718_c0_g1~~TRINITY_DN5718_c0_g1_i1.p1  ORF type:complete len:518 (+),score=80.23 TRINITY_DN5718_c0_g1_i1:581-2134(+)